MLMTVLSYIHYFEKNYFPFAFRCIILSLVSMFQCRLQWIVRLPRTGSIQTQGDSQHTRQVAKHPDLDESPQCHEQRDISTLGISDC